MTSCSSIKKNAATNVAIKLRNTPQATTARCRKLALSNSVYINISRPVPRGALSRRPSIRAATEGTRESATTNEAKSGKVIASANSRRISWKSLWIKTTGKKTSAVVAVAATTALLTSAVPSRAASIALFPRSKCLKMLSITTMLLSVNMPIANASPQSESTLSVRSQAYIRLKVANKEAGIAKSSIATKRALRRKRKSTAKPNTEPTNAACFNVSSESSINSAWLLVIINCTDSCAKSRLRRAIVSATASATLIRFSSSSFWINIPTADWPLTRLRSVRCCSPKLTSATSPNRNGIEVSTNTSSICRRSLNCP